MASYALIIGADAYWTPEASLQGAVRDALEVYDWVTHPDGGGVSERNTTLLLTPGEHSPEIPAGLANGTAGNDDVKTAIARLLQRSGGEGERLYVHFSGHGLSALAGAEEDAIVLSDFTPDLTEKSLAVGSIIECFAATAFEEQFLFFDACRNLAWDGNFQVGRLRAGRRDPLRHAPQQFVCFSTAPGVRAREVEERGAFTAALLAALRGAGPAKAWDDWEWRYVVRWNAVFSAVEQAMVAQQIDVGGDLIQRPRQAGERGGANPVLASFAPGSFPAETLRVTLEPAEAGSSAAIEVRDAADPVARESPVLETVSFPLEPRAYTVVASAPGLRPEHRYWAVDLYGPRDVTVRLLPDEASEPRDEAVDERRTRGLRHGAADARVTVVCADPQAPVEIADLAGTVLAAGDGAVEKRGLAAGFYYARVVLPDGVHDEELVSVAAGELERVELDAPAYPLPAPPDQGMLGVIITATGGPLGVRMWGLDETPSATPVRIPDGGGQLLRPRPPGPYLISFEQDGRPAVTLAVTVPVKRLVHVAVHAGPGGLEPVDITFPTPERPGTDQIVLAQRFMAAGRTDHVQRLAAETPDDPLAAVLLGYLPGHATGDVADRWPELPDAHVIAGVAAELAGDLATAAAAYRAALDRGLPVLARGASILDGAVERHEIEHPRAAVLGRAEAFNGLWTRLGEPRLRTSPAIELALDRAWDVLLDVASADEEQRAVAALAHPELLVTATLQRLGERAETRPEDVAGTVAWLNGIATALEAGETYPLGLGPIEGLWQRVSAGELDPAHATRLARDRRVAEALTPPYLRALSESLLELGDTQLALTRYAILEAAVATRGEAPASFVKDGLQLTARALMNLPDAAALETARERGETALAATKDAGTEAELLVSLGVLYLDPYTADRDSRSYEVDHARWLLRAGEAGARMPEPAEALRIASDYLRRAIAIAPEPQTLKALAQALMYTEVVGEPVDRAEIVSFAVRALAGLAPGELPSLRLSLIAMLRHLDQPVDADVVRATVVHSLDEYAGRFGDRVAIDIVRQYAIALTDVAPVEALQVVLEARGLVERIGDDRLREQALESELRYLRRAYTRQRFSERPEGGARAAAEAMRERARAEGWDLRDLAATLLEIGNASMDWDEERVALELLDEALALAPLLLHPHAEAVALLRAGLQVNIGSMHVAAGDAVGAIEAYGQALAGLLPLRLRGRVEDCLRRIDDLAQRGGAEVAQMVVLAIAPKAVLTEQLVGEVGTELIQRCCKRAIAGLAGQQANPEVYALLLEVAKGLRFGTALYAGSRFAEDAEGVELLAQIAELQAQLPSSAGALASRDPSMLLDEEVLLNAVVRGRPRRGQTAAERLANLQLRYDERLYQRLLTDASGSEAVLLGTDEIASALDARTALAMLYVGTGQHGGVAIHTLIITREGCRAGVVETDFPDSIVTVDGVEMTPTGFLASELRRDLRDDPGDAVATDSALGLLATDRERIFGWASETLAELRAAGKDHLCVIPHEALHYHPIHLVGDAGRTLGEEWIVSYLPNLNVLLSRRGAATIRKPRDRELTAIGLGFTDYNPHRLPPIGESLTEARAVAEIYGTRPLLDAEATEPAVREAMEHSRTIHIATHGRHNVDAAAFQSLFVAPSEDSDGRLHAYELLDFDLRGLDLVTLSACETALGRFDSADNLRGMPAMLLLSGVASIIGTLWDVETNVSEFFFTTLYRALREGQGRLDAFAVAQRETRARHPQYRDWGAFYFTGDWLS